MIDKQKAKAYDEALEHARQAYGTGAYDDHTLETIFPELAESEDERIRKFLIDILSSGVWRPEWPFSPIDCVAYLEKQKEQSFTHHEIDESLRDAVTHQMEDDGDVDDYVRRGIDDIALRYATLGAEWQNEQFEKNRLAACDAQIREEYERETDFVDKFIAENQRTPTFSDAINYGIAWQKEQKPISSCEIVPYIDDKIAALQDMWREEKVSFDWDDMKDMIEDVARHFYHKEQKPDIEICPRTKSKSFTEVYMKGWNDAVASVKSAEWNEEDEAKLGALINYFEGDALGYSTDDIVNWLKSLRPQPKVSGEK